MVHGVAAYDGGAGIYEPCLGRNNFIGGSKGMYISEFALGFVVGVIVGAVALVAIALRSGGGADHDETGDVPEREEDRNTTH